MMFFFKHKLEATFCNFRKTLTDEIPQTTFEANGSSKPTCDSASGTETATTDAQAHLEKMQMLRFHSEKNV